jgi:hypothetical protein
MRSSHRVATFVLLLGLGGLAPPTRAQSTWLDRTVPNSLQVEFAKPMFHGPDDGFFTFSGYLTTRLSLGTKLSFVGELPVATFALDSSSPLLEDASSTTVGNLYLGIESHPKPGEEWRGEGPTGTWFELGARVPLARDEELATNSGIASDVNRWEAFVPDAFVVRTAGHWHAESTHDEEAPLGLGVDVRVAPALWISDDFGDDVELFTNYGLQLLFLVEGGSLGLGTSGEWLMSREGRFDANSAHQFELALGASAGAVQLGLTLRTPMDDSSPLTDSLDRVVALSVAVALP